MKVTPAIQGNDYACLSFVCSNRVSLQCGALYGVSLANLLLARHFHSNTSSPSMHNSNPTWEVLAIKKCF